MLPKVRQIPIALSEEIRFEINKFDRYYLNNVMLFGRNMALYVIYDDMKNVLGIEDLYPEDMPFHQVVQHMWSSLTPEERNELIITQ